MSGQGVQFTAEYSARLDKAPELKTETTPEQGCVVGPFYADLSSGYEWKCLTKSQSLDEHIKINNFNVKSEDGLSEKQYFILTTDSYGKYPLYLELTNKETGAVSESTGAVIYQNDTFSVAPGEQVAISGIYTAGSGKYAWQYTVDPESGMKVEYTTKELPVYNESGEINIGSAVEQIFTFTPQQVGEYTIHFELIATGDKEPINDFYITVSVYNNGK